MATVVTGEKVIYGFLRSRKIINFTVSDDAVGQITATSSTGDPQVWDFQSMRGKGAVTFGNVDGDVDFVIYIKSGQLTHDFVVNDFIIEAERSISNGVMEGNQGGGGGNTNLTATYQASTVTVVSDSGNDAVVNAATTSVAGVMSAADKTKLNGVATGATANAADSALRDRATHTGTQTASTISDFATAADARISAQKGTNNGLATLDSGGKIPTGQLPSYVSDVLEYANQAAFPATGTSQKIYVALDTRKTFRWSGSAYVEISPSEVNSVNGRTGAVSVGAADVLNAAQISAGATSTVGTNNLNELINQNGGKDFKAQIIPRNQSIATLKTLVNGGGEIASSSDTLHIAKLHGTAGSGKSYFYHPMPINYTYMTPENQSTFAFVAESNVTGEDSTSGHVFVMYDQRADSGGNGPASVSALSANQKMQFQSALSNNYMHGMLITPSLFKVVHDIVQVTLKSKPLTWDGNAWTQGSPSENFWGQFAIKDDENNVLIDVYGENKAAGLVPELHLAKGSNFNLGFFGATPVLKRNPTNIGTGGARVGTTGNTVTDAATFTGGEGTSAYTIGQIVRALKQYGLLEM